MKIHLLSGFLGSGKTTAIQNAAQQLIRQGIKTGVVTNDQGSKLVDGKLFQSLDIPNREVINGCFCCNYQDLDAGIMSLATDSGTTVIFAESVGSCTDIVATVAKPLLQFHPEAQVTVSVFADVRLLQMMFTEGASPFDEDVRYIYLKQLEEAGIIVINKVDLINAEALAAVKDTMQHQYSAKKILYQDSRNTNSVRQWLETLDSYHDAGTLQSLNINYDIYAVGEAKLAWVDQVVEIFSLEYHALQYAQKLVYKIYGDVLANGFAIGHLKFLINDSIKLSFTSEKEPAVSLEIKPAATALVLINMRVQAAPGMLAELVAHAIAEIESEPGCRIIVNSLSAFQPGYPRPVYRM